MRKGIVLQARTGSTRLPRKMVMSFHKNKTIPLILLERLKGYFPDIPLILATSHSPQDDDLANQITEAGYLVFRGDEEDVLQRFIGVAKEFQLEWLIRVCADNPFLLTAPIEALLAPGKDTQYISYKFPDGTPVMKAHIGMFAEGVSLKLLETIHSSNPSQYYCEHVTTWVYDHPERKDLKFLIVPDWAKDRKDIRLTLDTEQDFQYLSELYAQAVLHGIENDPIALFKMINKNPSLREAMTEQIKANEK